MPLRAQLDGCPINAALLSEADRQALEASPLLRMPCCDAPAYRRTSRLGTRHFVHSPKRHCGAEGECGEHLAAKAEIVRACHDLGWAADSEAAGGQWRADVLATRDHHRVAFEVQWSNQTIEVTRERQAAYGTDVKCCWLFRKIPLSKGAPVIERDLPPIFSPRIMRLSPVSVRPACLSA
jgi:competence CoiA-like predicted nuclease